jgi:hypothetical protein
MMKNPSILLHDRPCQLLVIFDCLNGLNRSISECFLWMLHYAFFDCYLWKLRLNASESYDWLLLLHCVCLNAISLSIFSPVINLSMIMLDGSVSKYFLWMLHSISDRYLWTDCSLWMLSLKFMYECYIMYVWTLNSHNGWKHTKWN